MTSSKVLWVLLLCAIVAGTYLAGFTLGSQSGPVTVATGDSYEKGFAAGIADARQKLAASGLIPPTPEKLTTLSGTVTATTNGTLTIKASPYSINPLDPPGPATRTITVSGTTKIVSLTQLSGDEFSAALAQFNKVAATGNRPPPPSPWRETPAMFAEIKIGSVVTVSALDDVKSATTIKADKLIFTPVIAPLK